MSFNSTFLNQGYCSTCLAIIVRCGGGVCAINLKDHPIDPLYFHTLELLS